MHDLESAGEAQFAAGKGSAAAILNDIHGMVRRSQECNVAGYQPTDCPTREKHGWLGDAQVSGVS